MTSGEWSCLISFTWDTLIYSEYERGLLLRCIHHLKSDLINNMDHSGEGAKTSK